jgi:hypothetical protein
MIDFVKRKHEFDILANKIEQLQRELNVASEDAVYYKDILHKTRSQLREISAIIKPPFEPRPDLESAEQGYDRHSRQIIAKLKVDYLSKKTKQR